MLNNKIMFFGLAEIFFIFGSLNSVEPAPWTVEAPADVVVPQDSYLLETYELGVDPRSYNYAQDYRHEEQDRPDTYMEKKVRDTVSRGSAYLEGLRRALQGYAERLRNCTNLDLNEASDAAVIACRRVSREGERARRLAQLALWTTRQIQDTSNKQRSELEEKTLLARLAWLLERLARQTGYEPKPEDYLGVTTPAPTTGGVTSLPLLQLPVFNVSNEAVAEMIKCLESTNNDSRPAYERCPRAPIPETVQTLYNISSSISDNNPNASTAASVRQARSISTDLPSKNRDKRQSTNLPKTVDIGLPEDPYQDISSYSKSKEGTSLVANPEEVALARLALERHFNMPNSETVNRYGSNYNPLIPNVHLAGVLRTLLDI